jgi:hypothetical protein
LIDVSQSLLLGEMLPDGFAGGTIPAAPAGEAVSATPSALIVVAIATSIDTTEL